MSKTKIYLLDDHKIVRDGLKSIFAGSEAYEIVGEESHPNSFLEKLPTLQLDILILDISLPEMSGLALISKVKAMRPEVQIVMLSMHDGQEYVLKSFKEGANAYLPKNIEAGELIEALNQVRAKGSYYPNQISPTDSVATDTDNGEVLTPREKEVLTGIAQGMSSKEIALSKGLSPRTIEAHRLNIMKKLGTSNVAETMTLALKLKLIQL